MCFFHCNCADKIIEYLEKEKYETVPKSLLPEERRMLEDGYARFCIDVDTCLGMTESHKLQSKMKKLEELFYEKRLRK